MTITEKAAAIAIAIAACAMTASPASAATLAADRPCVNSQGAFAIAGSGYVPGSKIEVGPVGRDLDSERFLVDPTGSFSGVMKAQLADPFVSTPEQQTVLEAIDETDLRLATTPMIVAKPSVSIAPDTFDTRSKVTIRARGLTPGVPAFAHVMIGSRALRTIALGAAQLPCGTLSVRARLLRGLRFRSFVANLDVRIDHNPLPSTLLDRHGVMRLFISRPVIARSRRVRQARVFSSRFNDVDEAAAPPA